LSLNPTCREFANSASTRLAKPGFINYKGFAQEKLWSEQCLYAAMALSEGGLYQFGFLDRDPAASTST